MNGLMMDYQLSLPPILQRAETYFGDQEVVSRLPDKSFHRYTYAEMAGRAKQLAVALQKLGPARRPRRDAVLEPYRT
jgi:fatty-acyl-CoA synthase